MVKSTTQLATVVEHAASVWLGYSDPQVANSTDCLLPGPEHDNDLTGQWTDKVAVFAAFRDNTSAFGWAAPAHSFLLSPDVVLPDNGTCAEFPFVGPPAPTAEEIAGAGLASLLTSLLEASDAVFDLARLRHLATCVFVFALTTAALEVCWHFFWRWNHRRQQQAATEAKLAAAARVKAKNRTVPVVERAEMLLATTNSNTTNNTGGGGGVEDFPRAPRRVYGLPPPPLYSSPTFSGFHQGPRAWRWQRHQQRLAEQRAAEAARLAALEPVGMEMCEHVAGGHRPPPAALCCPIMLQLLREPVRTRYGHVFEREALLQWLGQDGLGATTCPLTRLPLSMQDVQRAPDVASAVRRWKRLPVGREFRFTFMSGSPAAGSGGRGGGAGGAAAETAGGGGFTLIVAPSGACREFRGGGGSGRDGAGSDATAEEAAAGKEEDDDGMDGAANLLGWDEAMVDMSVEYADELADRRKAARKRKKAAARRRRRARGRQHHNT